MRFLLELRIRIHLRLELWSWMRFCAGVKNRLRERMQRYFSFPREKERRSRSWNSTWINRSLPSPHLVDDRGKDFKKKRRNSRWANLDWGLRSNRKLGAEGEGHARFLSLIDPSGFDPRHSWRTTSYLPRMRNISRKLEILKRGERNRGVPSFQASILTFQT